MGYAKLKVTVEVEVWHDDVEDVAAALPNTTDNEYNKQVAWDSNVLMRYIQDATQAIQPHNWDAYGFPQIEVVK